MRYSWRQEHSNYGTVVNMVTETVELIRKDTADSADNPRSTAAFWMNTLRRLIIRHLVYLERQDVSGIKEYISGQKGACNGMITDSGMGLYGVWLSM